MRVWPKGALVAAVLWWTVVGLYPLAAQPDPEADARLEACLAEGKILKGGRELKGQTRPLKVEVQCGDRIEKAVFKYLHYYKPGKSTLANGMVAFNFSDSFRYERAAYLLDRELGLGMIPMAVLRTYRGKDGALVAWVPDAVHENQVTRDFQGPERASIARQKSLVRLFDSLIYDIDRRPPNLLVNETTARVYMIDHGQSFRETQALQEVFEQYRVWLTKEIYSRLETLNRERLDAMLKRLTTRGQRRTLLIRRDLVLEKIDRDRQQYGDAAVFIDLDQQVAQSTSLSSIE